MNERSGTAAEIFLWIAVIAICLIGVVTVLADDLFSVGRSSAPDAGVSVTR